MKRDGEEQIIMYVDSNIFILSVINHTILGDKAREVLKKINDNQIKAFSSCLTLDEVFYVLKKNLDKEDFSEFLETIFSLNIKWLEANINIIKESVELIKIYNLEPRDAIHVATMKLNNINSIISQDDDFDKIKEIKRIKLAQI